MGRSPGSRQPAPFFATVRGTLVLLLLAVLLPVLLAQVGLNLVNYYTRLGQEGQRQLGVARAIAVTFEGYVRDVERTELALGTALTASPPPPSAEQARLLTTTATGYAAIVRFNWLDPAGRAIASSDPEVVGLDLSDRAYVKAIQGGQEQVVSDLFRTRVGGQLVFAIARGIRNAQGSLLGIVVGVVDPTRLGALVLPINSTDGDAFAIFDSSGRLVYTRPEAAAVPIGQSWTDILPQLSQALAGQEVTGSFASPPDGQQRVFALEPIQTIGWAALASRPQAAITAPLVQGLLVQLGLLLGIGALGLAIALYGGRNITEPLGHLREHTLAVGRGELPPPLQPSGPVELQDLAATSNHMADQIRAREERIVALLAAERQARADAEAAVRARDQFLSGAAHELKTPITNLRGYAELALRHLSRRGTLEAQEQRRMFETIDRQADRLARLVSQLLDIAAIEVGQFELRRTDTDLVALAQEVVDRLPDDVKPRIRIQAPPAGLHADVDRERVAQVLLNLLDNALKFGPKDAPIEVELQPQAPDAVRLSVRDYGPGIPPQERPGLFVRFFQAGRPFSGLGLGLYYSRQIAVHHGGNAEADFPPDGGTRIVLTLPTRA